MKNELTHIETIDKYNFKDIFNVDTVAVSRICLDNNLEKDQKTLKRNSKLLTDTEGNITYPKFCNKIKI
jgi:hypothetical protein